MVAELCESATRFRKAGGISSPLLTGVTSGRAKLAGDNDDMSLYVYGNLEVKNLVAKSAAGISFEVMSDTTHVWLLSLLR